MPPAYFLFFILLSSGLAAISLKLGAWLQTKTHWLHDPVYVPSSDLATERIVRLVKSAKKQPQRVADLGSGDGKVVIALARAGYRVDGYEVHPWLVYRSRQKIKSLGLESQATIHRENIWAADLSQYEVVVAYFSESLMSELGAKLQRELHKTSYVISNDYSIPGWKASKQLGKVFFYELAKVY